jgi:hypothetical protein
MTSLTNIAEIAVLKWLTNNSPTAPTLPYRVALVTVLGTDSAAGTEATGTGYARQDMTVTNPSGDVFSNSALIRFSNLAAQTIVGVDIYDSAGTPVRWFHGALASSRALLAGDAFEFAVGTITMTAN